MPWTVSRLGTSPSTCQTPTVAERSAGKVAARQASMQTTVHERKRVEMRRNRLLPAVAGAVLALAAGATLAAIALAGTTHRTLRVRRDVHVTNAQFAADAAAPVDKRAAVAV